MRNMKEVICKICGYKTKTNGIHQHVTRNHNILYQDYKDKYDYKTPKEEEYLKENGFNKIWDCGSWKYEMRIK